MTSPQLDALLSDPMMGVGLPAIIILASLSITGAWMLIERVLGLHLSYSKAPPSNPILRYLHLLLWQYGVCRGSPARRHRLGARRVQFILRDQPKVVWFDLNSYWWPEFKAFR